MSEHILELRRRALEEAFFAKENERLRMELRRKYEHSSAKKSLMQAAGIFDDRVTEELLELDISADTLAALRLIPLIEVAWADYALDDYERKTIVGWARDQGGLDPDGPSQRLLETWLQKPPSTELFTAWKDYVSALYRTLAPEVRDTWKRQLFDSLNKVAEASGGVWGLHKVSVEERNLIGEVKAALDRR